MGERRVESWNTVRLEKPSFHHSSIPSFPISPDTRNMNSFMAKTFQILAVVLCFVGLAVSQAFAQDETDLPKKTQNPIADLISVPLKSKFNFGAGTNDKMMYTLNVQPDIPVHLTAHWNLIMRLNT